MQAIKFNCYECNKAKRVTDWRDYIEVDKHKFCSLECAAKYQRKHTRRQLAWYKHSMDQAGKFMHEVSRERQAQQFAINDLPF